MNTAETINRRDSDLEPEAENLEIEEIAKVLGRDYSNLQELLSYIRNRFPKLDESQPYFRIVRHQSGGKDIELGHERGRGFIMRVIPEVSPDTYRKIIGTAEVAELISPDGANSILEEIAAIRSEMKENRPRGNRPQLTTHREQPSQPEIIGTPVGWIEPPSKRGVNQTIETNFQATETGKSERQRDRSAEAREARQRERDTRDRELRRRHNIATSQSEGSRPNSPSVKATVIRVLAEGDLVAGAGSLAIFGISYGVEWASEFLGVTPAEVRYLILGVSALPIVGRRLALPLFKWLRKSRMEIPQ